MRLVISAKQYTTCTLISQYCNLVQLVVYNKVQCMRARFCYVHTLSHANFQP